MNIEVENILAFKTSLNESEIPFNFNDENIGKVLTIHVSINIAGTVDIFDIVTLTLKIKIIDAAERKKVIANSIIESKMSSLLFLTNPIILFVAL